MFFYKVYGLVFRSNIEMPQLLETECTDKYDADIIVGKVSEDVKQKAKDVWGVDDGKTIWFHNSTGYFWSSETEIIVEPKPGVLLKDIIPFIQGYCFAIFFRIHGMHAVHCSALKNEKGAVLVAGYSGVGKSTMCDKLLQDGYALMADDVAILRVEDEKVMVYPAFPMRKMCRDALNREEYDLSALEYIDEDRDKFAIRYDEQFDENPTELYRMIILKKKKDIQKIVTKEEKGRDALMAFIESLFLVATFSYLEFPPKQMQSAIDVVKNAKGIFTVRRPVEEDTVEAVYSEIKRILA